MAQNRPTVPHNQDPAFDVTLDGSSGYDADSDNGSLASLGAQAPAMLERLQEERFRLVHLLREIDERKGRFANPPSAAQIKELNQRISQLDAAVDQRFISLDNAQKDLDERIAKLSALRQAIAEVSSRFAEQAAAIRGADRTVTAAVRKLDEAVGDAQHRIAQHVELAGDEMSKASDQAASVVNDQATRLLVDFDDKAASVRNELTQFQVQLENLFTHVSESRCHIDRQLEDAADVLGKRVSETLDKAREPINAEIAQLLARVKEEKTQLEQQVMTNAELLGSIRGKLDHYLEKALPRIDARIEVANAQMDEREQQISEGHQQRLDEIAQQTDDAATRLDQREKAMLEAAGRADEANAANAEHRNAALASQAHDLEDRLSRCGQYIADQTSLHERDVKRFRRATRRRAGRLFDFFRKLRDALRSDHDEHAASLEAQAQQHAEQLEAALARCMQTMTQHSEQLASEHAATQQQSAERFEQQARQREAAQQELAEQFEQQVREHETAINEQSQQWHARVEAAAGAAAQQAEQAQSDLRTQFAQHADQLRAAGDEQIEKIAALRPEVDQHDQRIRAGIEEAQRRAASMQQSLADRFASFQPRFEQMRAELDKQFASFEPQFEQMQEALQDRIDSVEPKIEDAHEAIERAMHTLHEQSKALQTKLDEQFAGYGPQFESLVADAEGVWREHLDAMHAEADDVVASVHETIERYVKSRTGEIAGCEISMFQKQADETLAAMRQQAELLSEDLKKRLAGVWAQVDSEHREKEAALSTLATEMVGRFETLRCELREQMKQARDSVVHRLKISQDAAVRKIESHHEAKLETLAGELDKQFEHRQESLSQHAREQLETLRQELDNYANELVNCVQPHTEQMLARSRQRLDAARDEIVSELDSVQRQLQQRVTAVHEQIQTELTERSGQVRHQLEEHAADVFAKLRQTRVQVMSKAGDLDENFREQLDQRLAEQQERADTMVQLFNEQLIRQTADLDVQHRQLLGHIESKVREALDRIDQRMKRSTSDADAAAEKQVEALRNKANAALQPFIESMEDHLAKFQKRAQQSALAAEAALHDHRREIDTRSPGEVNLGDPQKISEAMNSVSRKVAGRTPTNHAA